MTLSLDKVLFGQNDDDDVTGSRENSQEKKEETEINFESRSNPGKQRPQFIRH